MDRRVVGVMMVFLASVLLAVSTLTNMWWTANERKVEVGVGLTEIEACGQDGFGGFSGEGGSGGRCESISLKKMLEEGSRDDDDKDGKVAKAKRFVTFGNLTFYLGVIAASLLGLAGLLAMGNLAVPGPVSPGRIGAALCLATLIGAILFVSQKPDDAEELKLGAGLPLALVGCVAGIAGGIIVSMWRPVPGQTTPLAATPGPPPGPPQQSAAGPAPACPQCSAPADWVAEHARWFCARCRVYL